MSFKCLVEKVLADGGVEFCDVEANKSVMLFVFNSFKPLDHGGGVFPLVEFGCSTSLFSCILLNIFFFYIL